MTSCRAYDPADRDACLDLLRRGHDPRFTESRFAWLHEDGPAGPSHKVVCESNGRVVGLSAVLPRPALLDGRVVIAGRDVDPVVDPDCRGQGLFSRMLEWTVANTTEVDVFYNFANPASAPGFRKRGWTQADALVDHVAQLGYRRLLSREGLLWAVSRLARPRYRDLPVRELDGDQVADLPTPAPTERRFAVLRDADYLHWRFCRSPLHRYLILARYDGDEIVDLVVARAEPEVRRIILVDLVSYRQDGGEFAAYLPELERRFGGWWVAVWSTIPAAWRRGFVKSPRAGGLPLLVRTGESVPALGAGDCLVTHGDLEAN